MKKMIMPFSIPFPGCLLLSLLIFGGCATSSPPLHVPHPTKPPSSGGLLREAKAEADSLRVALAAERIALAKQQAKIRSSQNALASIRTREASMVEEMTSIKEELSSLKTDRDRLRKENAELRGKTTAMPQFLQLMTEIRSLQTSFNSLADAMNTFKADFVTFRKEWQASRNRVNVRTRGPASPAPRVVSLKDGEGFHVTVQPGDSLWGIADTYGITVEEIQALNYLKGDIIFPGQQLRLPMNVAHSSTSKISSSEATDATAPSVKAETAEKP